MIRKSGGFFLVIIASVLLCTPFVERASGSLIKLAETGDSEPKGTNTYLQIGPTPTLSENGQVVFCTDLRNGGVLQGWGIFISDGQSIKTVARSGQPSPDVNGNFYTFTGMVSLNNTSQVFETGLNGTLGGGSDSSGLYRVDGGRLSILARAGQPVPGENVSFASFNGVIARINSSGQTSFLAKSATNPAVIFRSTGSTLIPVATLGQQSPDGNGTLGLAGPPSLNNRGTVVFIAIISATNASPYGIFMDDGSGLRVLLRSGQPLPDGTGQISSFLLNQLALNDSNQIAFVANLSGTTAGVTDNLGLYRAEAGVIVPVARKSQLAPNGNGRFLDFGAQNRVVINNAGSVAFFADLTGTSGGSNDNAAIFLSTATGLLQVVRTGQPAPGGNGTFSKLGYPTLNNNGELAFVATLSGTKGGTNDNQGIYFVDAALSIKQVIRSGQVFNGKTIATPTFLDGPNYGGLAGFNDRGQLAIWAALNGHSAIFLWSNTDAQNGLRILSATATGKDVAVSFQGQAGTTNFLQAAPSVAGPFVDVGRCPLLGTGTVATNVTEPGARTNVTRFYRIRQVR